MNFGPPPINYRRPTSITVPSGLGWDQTNAPLSLKLYETFDQNVGSAGITPESVFDAVSTARSAPGATFYIDGRSGVGSDSAAGTVVAPFRSIWKGVVAANAGGVPSKIIVLNTGTYERALNPWNNGGSGVVPTVDVAFVASGGRIQTGVWESTGTLTKDATYTNCCAFTVGTVDRVMDLLSHNRFGNYVEFIQVSTAAICNSTPNSWAYVSGTLYMNRADGNVVTSLNTRMLRGGFVYSFRVTTAVNVFIGGETSLDGFDVEGGPMGALEVEIASGSQPSVRKVLAVKNSSFRYGGGATHTQARSVSVEGLRGLTIFENCRADASQTDGFNFHNANGAASMQVLTINCSAFDNGRLGNGSCNGWTSHDDVVGIDIAGYYEGNHGGTMRSINSSKSLLVGSVVKMDMGDYLIAGYSLRPVAVQVDDFATYWCDRVRTQMPAATRAYVANGNSTIHKRNCWATLGATGTLQSGTVDTY